MREARALQPDRPMRSVPVFALAWCPIVLACAAEPPVAPDAASAAADAAVPDASPPDAASPDATSPDAGVACRTITATDLSALDLTVTRHVRAIYFTPSDRPFRACVHEHLDRFAYLAQAFFRDELAAHGFVDGNGAGKTFALDAAPDGTWDVVYLVGEQPAAFYQAQDDAPGAAMAEMFRRVPAAFHERNVTLYLYDLAVVEDRAIRYSGNGGSGAPWEGEGTGYVLQGAHFLGLPGFDTIALDAADQGAMFERTEDAGVDDWDGDQAFGPLTRGEYTSTYLGAALHELGHAFYLDHLFTDYDGDGVETNLMGNGFRRLSGRYTPAGYQPPTELGPDHAAALDAAWMFQP